MIETKWRFDGQQRFTTLIFLIKAIRNWTDNEYFKKKLFSYYNNMDNYDKEVLSSKLVNKDGLFLELLKDITSALTSVKKIDTDILEKDYQIKWY